MDAAFFDFDKTLTCVDTTLPFAFFVLKERNRKCMFIDVVRSFLLYRLGIYTHQRFKDNLCGILVKNEGSEPINSLSCKFFEMHFQSIKNEGVIRRLLGHADRGDLTYIISSNFEFFLRPIYDLLPVRRIEATKAFLVDGVFTGKLMGRVCDKEEKVARALSLMSEISGDKMIYYGDSAGDYPLMRRVDEYHIVRYMDVAYVKKLRRLVKGIIGRFDEQECETYLSSRF